MSNISNLTNKSLSNFFTPKSIAIIGASGRENTIGWRIIYNLKSGGYQGAVYPINPNSDQILDYKAYKSLFDVEESIDLVAIVVSADKVVEALDQCEKVKVKNVVIITSGFAESGIEGQTTQRHFTEWSKRTGIRILGPNCQGFANFLADTVVSISRALECECIKGSTALVSQSGATGHALYNMAIEKGIGTAYLVTTGNEADLTALEFMDGLLDDPHIDLILSYAEGLKDIKNIMQIGKKSLDKNKPIIIMKPGKSAVAQKAIVSHTAALAGSEQIIDTVFKQAGIIRVNDTDELLDTAYLFSKMKLRPMGRRIAIFTTTGGVGITMADACAEFGMQVPDLQPETNAKLEEALLSFTKASNPLDASIQLLYEPERYRKVILAMLEDPGIDILVIGSGSGFTGKYAVDQARLIASVAEFAKKPIIVACVNGEKATSQGVEVLNTSGIPAFNNTWRCARALNNVIKFEESIAKSKKKTQDEQEIVFKGLSKILLGEECVLPEYEAKQFMREAGFTTVRERLVQTAQEAVDTANEFGYPVVLKIHSPQILHKTESGGVKLNLLTANDVADAFENILANVKAYNPQAEVKGVLVQEMVTNGVEVILGSTCDPLMGPVIMFGLGGIYVELAKDVTFRIPPITKDEALAMIADTKIAYSVLSGARGRTPCDIDNLAEVISRFSYLVSELGDNIEVDLNPVVVMPNSQGCRIVDALIIRRK